MVDSFVTLYFATVVLLSSCPFSLFHVPVVMRSRGAVIERMREFVPCELPQVQVSSLKLSLPLNHGKASPVALKPFYTDLYNPS